MPRDPGRGQTMTERVPLCSKEHRRWDGGRVVGGGRAQDPPPLARPRHATSDCHWSYRAAGRERESLAFSRGTAQHQS